MVFALVMKYYTIRYITFRTSCSSSDSILGIINSVVFHVSAAIFCCKQELFRFSSKLKSIQKGKIYSFYGTMILFWLKQIEIEHEKKSWT